MILARAGLVAPLALTPAVPAIAQADSKAEPAGPRSTGSQKEEEGEGPWKRSLARAPSPTLKDL